MSELIQKVNAAIHFGVPDGSVAEDIMQEVHELIVTNVVLERKLSRVREIAFGCEDDDPATHEAAALREIKKVIDE
jgi:hypothetical protein